MNKKELRAQLLDTRKNISEEDRHKKSKIIIDKLMSTVEYKNANTIMAFASFGTEVETHDFIKTALASGKRIILPISIKEDRSLFLQEIKSFDELKPSTYGILEPEKKVNFEKKALDLVIVPGVAFDHRGFRMGYGGGYYDRFLASLNKRTKIVAISFEELYVYRVIISRFDMKVPVLITDRKIRNFQRRTLWKDMLEQKLWV